MFPAQIQGCGALVARRKVHAMAQSEPRRKTRDNQGLEPHSEADEPVSTHTSAIREASLFDQFADDSHPDSPETVEPETNADDMEEGGSPGVDAEAREAEKERMRTALRKNQDRRSLPADRDNWDSNRHGGDGRR
jgi:hypothetical protein